MEDQPPLSSRTNLPAVSIFRSSILCPFASSLDNIINQQQFASDKKTNSFRKLGFHSL